MKGSFAAGHTTAQGMQSKDGMEQNALRRFSDGIHISQEDFSTMKLSKWLVAAALLFTTVGGVAQAQDVTLPDRGTTEYNLSGNIGFDDNQGWNLNGRWAPFMNQNLQWGIDLNVQDGPGFDTSGFIGALVNWHFPGTGGGRTLPYVGVGLAAAYGDFSGSTYDIHGGIKHFVSSDVAFTAELQWRKFSDALIFGGDDSSTTLNFGFSLFR